MSELIRAKRWQGRALLFDLFGTVVHFSPQVPIVEVAGTPWRTTMQWLRAAVEREAPELSFDDLLPMLMRVTEEIVRQRPPEFLEVPSPERFRRALERLGVDAARAPHLAQRLSLAHMGHLASTTRLPAAHPGVLRALGSRYRMGLVSNFDHAPTARRVLAEHGVAEFFEVVIISDEFGRRKPHRSIFDAACRRLEVGADQALFIGDSPGDDVVGAHGAGLPVVWINAKNQPLPSGVPQPDHIIAELTELPALLD